MIDTSSPSELSRRSLLAGLAAAPIVTATTEQSLAQTVRAALVAATGAGRA